MFDFVELSNKQTNSVRTIEELLLEFVPQTFKRYFQKFLPKASRAAVVTSPQEDRISLVLSFP